MSTIESMSAPAFSGKLVIASCQAKLVSTTALLGRAESRQQEARAKVLRCRHTESSEAADGPICTRILPSGVRNR